MHTLSLRLLWLHRSGFFIAACAFVVCTLLALPAQVLAQDKEAQVAIIEEKDFPKEPGISVDESVGKAITKLRYTGLKRTELKVVRTELLLDIGKPITKDDFTESIQRLRNLGIFATVEPTILPDGNGVALYIQFVEKWTILPIAKVGAGGNTFFFLVGLYDFNLFGRYLELGGRYDNYNGAHAGVMWFRDPRFLGQRLQLGAEFWWTRLPRRLWTDAGDQRGAFLHSRIRPRLFLRKEISRYFFVAGGIEYNGDSASETSLSDDDLEANRENDYRLPGDERYALADVSLTVGRLDFDDFLFEDCYEIIATYQRSFETFGATEGFNMFRVVGTEYLKLPLRSNLAFRQTVAVTDSDTIYQQFFVGGVDFVRGFLDGQFQGSSFWQVNAEYRIPSLDTSWLVLQHAFFVDVASVSNSLSGTFGKDMEPTTGLGGGIRLFSPRIARATLRFDYAAGFGERFNHGLFFSASQFF